MQRPRVICLAATLVAGASMLASVPAAGQSALFPGELRPSVPGQSDIGQLDQSGEQTNGQTGNGSLIGPSLYSTSPETGAGTSGFVSIGNRKVKVKVKPGSPPAAPVADRATLLANPAQLGTAALRPKSRLRKGGLLDLPRAVELQRPLNVPPDFVIVPPIAPLRQLVVDLNPFGPTGVHVGTFYLLPAVELTGGWDSNPQHATIAKSAPEYLLAPELMGSSDWERHSLTFNIHGSYLGYGSTFFPNSPVWLNRPGLDSRVNGRMDVDSHDHVDIEGRFLIGTDNPGSPNIQAGLEDLPITLNGGATLGYTHVFNRFEITAKGTFDRYLWQKSFLTDGTYSSNGDRNYDQIGGSLRGSYDLLPGVKPFFQVDSDERVHDITVDDTGAMRDSDGQIYKVGTSFLFSGKLTGEISVGRTQREYRDPALAEVAGPMVDGSLLYTPNSTHHGEVQRRHHHRRTHCRRGVGRVAPRLHARGRPRFPPLAHGRDEARLCRRRLRRDGPTRPSLFHQHGAHLQVHARGVAARRVPPRLAQLERLQCRLPVQPLPADAAAAALTGAPETDGTTRHFKGCASCSILGEQNRLVVPGAMDHM